MRKKIVAGNWKMNTTVPEGVELAKAVVEKSAQVPESVGLIIATPFTHLVPVSEVVKGSKVELSAENCADKEKGAYTGEVSAAMLASAGCEYTILGHSERRQYYGETDETLVAKVNLALANGLGVIFCVGENLEQREAGKHFEVVTSQIENVLFGLTAEPLLQSRLRKSTPASVKFLPASSARRLQRIPPSSTAEAASLQMLKNCSHALISTAVLSAVQLSRLTTSSR